MADASVHRRLREETAAVSPLTTALFATTAVMVVCGLASALASVPPVVRTTYYASVFLVVGLLWIHGFRTARRM